MRNFNINPYGGCMERLRPKVCGAPVWRRLGNGHWAEPFRRHCPQTVEKLRLNKGGADSSTYNIWDIGRFWSKKNWPKFGQSKYFPMSVWSEWVSIFLETDINNICTFKIMVPASSYDHRYAAGKTSRA